jgi:hypothetical protein
MAIGLASLAHTRTLNDGFSFGEHAGLSIAKASVTVHLGMCIHRDIHSACLNLLDWLQ